MTKQTVHKVITMRKAMPRAATSLLGKKPKIGCPSSMNGCMDCMK